MFKIYVQVWSIGLIISITKNRDRKSICPPITTRNLTSLAIIQKNGGLSTLRRNFHLQTHLVLHRPSVVSRLIVVAHLVASILEVLFLAHRPALAWLELWPHILRALRVVWSCFRRFGGRRAVLRLCFRFHCVYGWKMITLTRFSVANVVFILLK